MHDWQCRAQNIATTSRLALVATCRQVKRMELDQLLHPQPGATTCKQEVMNALALHEAPLPFGIMPTWQRICGTKIHMIHINPQ